MPASLAVLSPLIYGLQRVQYARVNYGPVAAQEWSNPWYNLSAIALIPLLLLGLRRLRRHHRGVLVYKNGLLIKGIGRRKQYFGWSEISGIATKVIQERFLGFRIRERHQVTLHPSIGKPVKMDPRIPQLDELSARIKAKIYPRLLQELRASLKSGATLYFGQVHMNQHKIRIREKNYPWEQIASIQIQKGMLMIEFGDHQVRRIPVGEFINIDIFLQLIQEGLIA